ncbi:polyamine aminopropyltransferase [Endozoicomonas sp. GU-1]|uniref:polyamine aminopropyltransferase n=1 Tax=Endozoicomonas sp. GU-1 TaxID=3009078 RepID=UPI0022B3A9FD|nr:polyamine aminopropyltransferase [Endozoicomonas sp. GU-1]WBA81210.1 polyamine aminopropyltransferase [Endozoicomonas sp. GU-1]WBA84158.1 polyamine aminopropyltransferase [Endozoicomonas sp. GU-1]
MHCEDTYQETLYSGYGQNFSIDRLLFEDHTEHQHLIIFENRFFGRIMALDGVIQTTEKDEFIYHEMLTHVPILAHGKVKRVLIIGGGDGGMLREVLRHRSVEQVTMVEIDRAVVDLCRQWLPNHCAGAYDDPRVNLVIEDGVRFVNNHGIADHSFDVIISDCTDPIGPGEVLFSSEFYRGCKRLLTDKGIFVAQNGVPFMQLNEVTTTAHRLASYVSDLHFYSAAVPTYACGIMTFAWGTDDLKARHIPLVELEARFAHSNITTRYYTPEVHLAAFALPRYIETAIAEAVAEKQQSGNASPSRS